MNTLTHLMYYFMGTSIICFTAWLVWDWVKLNKLERELHEQGAHPQKLRGTSRADVWRRTEIQRLIDGGANPDDFRHRD